MKHQAITELKGTPFTFKNYSLEEQVQIKPNTEVIWSISKPKNKNIIYCSLCVIRCGGWICFSFFKRSNTFYAYTEKFPLIQIEIQSPYNFPVHWMENSNKVISFPSYLLWTRNSQPCSEMRGGRGICRPNQERSWGWRCCSYIDAVWWLSIVIQNIPFLVLGLGIWSFTFPKHHLNNKVTRIPFLVEITLLWAPSLSLVSGDPTSQLAA